MIGHFHLEITTADEELKFINNCDFKKAARSAKRYVSKGGRLTGYAFICGYGCGLYHDFEESEVAQLIATFPGHAPKQLRGQHS